MEQNEKSFYLNKIYWLCYVDKNNNVGVIPYVYNDDRTAIQNLIDGSTINGDFMESTPTEIAEKLGVNNVKTCSIKRYFTVIYDFFKSSKNILLPYEIKQCARLYSPDKNNPSVNDIKLEEYASKKLMTSKDLKRFIKKLTKIYKNETKKALEDTRQC